MSSNSANTYISCGVKQVYSLEPGKFKRVVKKTSSMEVEDTSIVGGHRHFIKGYIYIFSDNMCGNGKEISRLIKDNQLGDIIETEWAVNPNSNNRIKVWVWNYNGIIPEKWA